MGLADGPTEVHKITVARQVLREYKATTDLFPTEHIPKAARGSYPQIRGAHRTRGVDAIMTAPIQYGFSGKVVCINGCSRGLGHAMPLGSASGRAGEPEEIVGAAL
jgi:hypothetical protein